MVRYKDEIGTATHFVSNNIGPTFNLVMSLALFFALGPVVRVLNHSVWGLENECMLRSSPSTPPGRRIPSALLLVAGSYFSI